MIKSIGVENLPSCIASDGRALLLCPVALLWTGMYVLKSVCNRFRVHRCYGHTINDCALSIDLNVLLRSNITNNSIHIFVVMSYSKLFSVFLLGSMVLLGIGCSEDDPVTPSIPEPNLKSIEVRFMPTFGDDPLVLGQKYVNAAGDSIAFTVLKFYASEFGLVNVDGSKTPMEGIELVDFADSQVEANGYYSYTVKGEPGTYSGLKFAVGVPFDQNHRDVSTQTEPLGPNSGMYWGWNPGYQFFKVEGRVDSMGTPVNFLYHTGEDNRRKTVRLASLAGDNVTEFTVADNDDNVYTVKVDYSKFFARGLDPSEPMNVKMNPGERTNHVGPKDLADRTAANFAEMFSTVQ